MKNNIRHIYMGLNQNSCRLCGGSALKNYNTSVAEGVVIHGDSLCYMCVRYVSNLSTIDMVTTLKMSEDPDGEFHFEWSGKLMDMSIEQYCKDKKKNTNTLQQFKKRNPDVIRKLKTDMVAELL